MKKFISIILFFIPFLQLYSQVPFLQNPDWISTDVSSVSTGGAFADINMDGWLDFVVANGNDISRQKVVVYYNNGDGTFPTSPNWQSADIDYHGHLDVGDVNEDGEGYFDGNRDWAFNWQPPYVQTGAGNYPFEGSGTRAIAEWMLARPNIIMVFAFHNSGGLYLRGPSFKAAGEMLQGDISVYNYLGENIEKIVPGYEYLISWKDLYSTYGDFTDFTTNLIGSYSFVGELYQSEMETFDGTFKMNEEDRSKPDGLSKRDRQRLQFNDRVTQGELFKDWKPYKHPLYGDIEIGGWVKVSSRLPHPFMLPDLVHRNASAVIFAAQNTPKVTMDVFETKRIKDNLWSVRVRLVNRGVMPTVTYQTMRNRLYPPDVLTVSGESARVVSGGKLTDTWFGTVDYKEYKPEVQLCQVPGFGKIEYQFLVVGRGNVDIKFESRKAGTVSESIQLK